MGSVLRPDGLTPAAAARRRSKVMAGLTMAISLLLLVVVALSGMEMNRAAQSMEENAIRREIDRQVTRALEEQKSVALWDEAVQRIRLRDEEWLTAEVGAYLHGSYGHDDVYVIDGANELVYSYPADAARFEAIWAAVAPVVGEIRGDKASRLRQRSLDFKPMNNAPPELSGASALRWSAHILKLGDAPAIVSAMTMVPTTGGKAGGGDPPIIISTISLDAARLAALGRSAGIADLRLVKNDQDPGGGAHIRLTADSGVEAGFLQWVPSHPGQNLFRYILPALVLATLWAFYASVSALHRMVAMSRGMEESEMEARRLADYDVLSGLPNRRQFLRSLDEQLDGWRKGRCERPLVAYLDLDRFKEVNDTLGHEAGDALVRSLGDRLKRLLPARHLLARLGGDEFAVMMPAADPLAGWKLGRELCAAFAVPVQAGGQEVQISGSIGIAVPASERASSAELLREADIALYRAKEAGRGRAVIFRPEMAEAVERRRETELDLRKAIDGGQLRLVYQPVLTIEGAPTFKSVEALLRWEHPERGLVSPEEFIPIAETSGQMNALGEWVLTKALQDIARWPGLQVAVNLSPVQLKAEGFVRRAGRMVAAARVRPSQIIFEVTENVMMDASGQAGQALKDLRELGFKIALDDFGTGFSSLSYLRQFQFDRLKIDRSFIEGVEQESEAMAVVEMVVALGRRLGLEVVAEGIENEVQARLMKAAGCTHLQGWFVARPLEHTAIAQMLDTSPRVEPIVRMLRGSAA